MNLPLKVAYWEGEELQEGGGASTGTYLLNFPAIFLLPCTTLCQLSVSNELQETERVSFSPEN